MKKLFALFGMLFLAVVVFCQPDSTLVTDISGSMDSLLNVVKDIVGSVTANPPKGATGWITLLIGIGGSLNVLLVRATRVWSVLKGAFSGINTIGIVFIGSYVLAIILELIDSKGDFSFAGAATLAMPIMVTSIGIYEFIVKRFKKTPSKADVQ